MSGFHDADITKGLMMFTAVTTLSASLLDVKPYLHLQLTPHLTTYHQFWRILIHPLAFANSTELVMGLLLFSSAGVSTERQVGFELALQLAFGPRKYASFILLSSIVSTIISLGMIILLYPFGVNHVPAGPYGVIFSLLWQRHRIVPAVYVFRILGIEVSNKFFTYILALQLILSDPPASIVASIAGVMTGYIYRSDTVPLPSLTRRRLLRPLKTYRIPLSLYLLLARLFRPLVGGSAPPRRAHRTLPGETRASGSAPDVVTAGALRTLLGGRQGGARAGLGMGVRTRAGAGVRTTGEGEGNDDAVDAPRGGAGGARAAVGEWVSEMTGRGAARAPTEDEIATLSSMFPNLSREAIVRALQRNDHNTAQAVEALLQEST